MRSSLHDILPVPVRRSLVKMGRDLSLARRRRRFTIATMSDRIGVVPNTYRKMEKGDPSVAMGAYAMALFVLGYGGVLGDLLDVRHDEIGLQLEEERLPQRVRVKKSPTLL